MSKLKKEVGALCLCDNRNIVDLKEIIYYENFYYVVLVVSDHSVIELSSLIQTIHSKSQVTTFPVDVGLYLLYEILEALTHIHEQGIIHRSLILSSFQINQVGEVKLCNFSEAIILTKENHSHVNTTFRTPRIHEYYLSPELIKKTNYTELTDIWSFGLLFINIFENRIPFKSNNKTKVELSKLVIESKQPLLSNKIEYDSHIKKLQANCTKHKSKLRPGSKMIQGMKNIWNNRTNVEEFQKYLQLFV